MRNLKRVLSLALASVMLMGMMVIGAGAAEAKKPITDLDKVTNKDAVNLMVALDIVKGRDSGAFDPAGLVNRAEMATFIYRVMNEGSNDASLYVGTGSPFKDVVKGHWAEGFINYAASLNIVAGKDIGFDPDGKVKVVEAAKMLLVILGYNSKLSKFENDANWAINIMKEAQRMGIMAGVTQKPMEELTRDNAAQMVFNALNAKTVKNVTERDMGVEYLKDVVKNPETLGYDKFGLIKVTAKVTGITDGKADIDLASVKPALTGIALNGKIPASANAVGQTVDIYVKAAGVDFSKSPIEGTFKSIVSSSIAGTASNLLGSKVGVSIADMADKTKKTKFVAELADSVTFYNNGKVLEDISGGKTAKVQAEDLIKAGVVVEFFGTGKADVVKLTVKDVKKVTGDVKTKTSDEGVVTVYIPGVVGSAGTYASAKGYEDLKKGDIVLIYKGVDNVTYIEKAATVVGKVTSRNSDFEIKVDGTFYGKSELIGTTVDHVGVDNWTDFTNEYTFYLDNGKNIVAAKSNTEKSTSDYALVVTTKWIEGGTIGNSDYMQAKILFTDATTKIVTVTKIGGKTVVKTVKDAAKEVVYTDLTETNGFYGYTVDSDGNYELTVGAGVDGMTKGTVAADTEIKNKSAFGAGSADSKTLFLVLKGKTYTTYTGYSNVPGMTAKSGVTLNDKDGIAKFVYLSTEAFAGDVPAGYIYVIDNTSYEYDAATKSYVYDIINAEGQADIIKAKDTSVFTAKGLFEIKSQNADKIVSTADAKTPDALTILKNGILKAGTSYDYNDDTAFYVIDVSKDGKKVTSSVGNSIDLTDEAYTYTAAVNTKTVGSSLATAVYVVRTAK